LELALGASTNYRISNFRDVADILGLSAGIVLKTLVEEVHDLKHQSRSANPSTGLERIVGFANPPFPWAGSSSIERWFHEGIALCYLGVAMEW
jgi:hypothetical protein